MLHPSLKISIDNNYPFPEDDNFRNEVKYILSQSEYLKIRDLCSGFMQPDKNAGEGNEYIVKSYYFDTLNYRDYFDKQDGIYARQKYRIRTYNDSGYYRLEKKIKRGNRNIKKSGVLSAGQANSMLAGNMDIKTGNEVADAIIVEMQLKGCRNSAYIQYSRRVFAMAELDIRITFDSDVRVLFGEYTIYEPMPEPVLTFYNNAVILEVKYKNQIPGWLQRAVYHIAPSDFSVSKYAQSISCFLG